MPKDYTIKLTPQKTLCNEIDNHIYITLDEGGKSIMLSLVNVYDEADVWLSKKEARLLIDRLTLLTAKMTKDR